MSPEKILLPYSFEHPEIEQLARDMIAASEQSPDWNTLCELLVQMRTLSQTYGERATDIHEGLFQILDKISNDAWHSAFNFFHNLFTHPNTALGQLDGLGDALHHPYDFLWIQAFMPLQDVAQAVKELKQKLGIEV
jgi:hypothetical protein